MIMPSQQPQSINIIDSMMIINHHHHHNDYDDNYDDQGHGLVLGLPAPGGQVLGPPLPPHQVPIVVVVIVVIMS